MRPITPRGFRDVLPAEAAEREVTLAALAEVFASWGYGLVETPVAEGLDTLEAAAGPLEGTAFRLIDSDGRMLALRPDMTVPLARVGATRLGVSEGPQRLRYATQVFREHESLRGQARQFTQAGVELLGSGGPAADAEVIALLCEALAATGLPEFTVALGTVAVLSAIVDAAGGDSAWRDAVFSAAHDRNLVELDRLAGVSGLAPAAAGALRTVPRINGGIEALAECRAATVGCGCEAVLDELDAMLRLLEATGALSRVRVDFSVMRSFGYYTGIVFEVYAPGLGLALAGGGRYDDVLATFGAPAPAVGFALGIERLSIALVEQGAQPVTRGLDAVVGGPAQSALVTAAGLRAQGKRVALSSQSGEALIAEARRLGAREAIEAAGNADGGDAL